MTVIIAFVVNVKMKQIIVQNAQIINIYTKETATLHATMQVKILAVITLQKNATNARY